MKISYQISVVAACLAALCLASHIHAHAQKGAAEAYGIKWKDISSFSINRSESYIVFSQIDKGSMSERVYEATNQGGPWVVPNAIEVINKTFEGGSIGGVFLTDDERRLYFHARTADAANGYDIYYSDKLNGQWTAPVRVDRICTVSDETSPSVISGEEGIYFLRHQQVSDAKQERKTAEKMTIYYASKTASDKWGKAQPINPAVSFGYVQDVRIARDGASLFYSVRKDRREQSLPFFTRLVHGGAWLLPECIVTEPDDDYYCAQLTDKHLFYIHGEDKKVHAGSIVMMPLPDAKFKDKPTVTERGSVLSTSNGKPIVADIVVKDPTTGSVIGRYKSKSDDGSFHIVNADSKPFMVDVRAAGFSFASYQLFYDGNGQPQMPSKIMLSDTISLGLSVFDAEIFRPVNGKVIAVRQTDKAIFRSVKDARGIYELRLPLGSNYNIIATGKNYNENKFLFRLEGDIVFNHYERELPLTPQKRQIAVKINDAVTSEPIQTGVLFNNLLRVEKVDKAEADSDVRLREGDKYEVSVRAPHGYAFKHFEFNLAKDPAKELEISLLPLREGTTLQLENILFETASAFLLPEAYEELDRLVKLLAENPELVVEISAHTDNVGNAAYNLKLSDARAASVVDYLVENGADAARLVSKGYGLTKPLVPNTSDENRQKNRRVEFSIVSTVTE